MTTKLVLEQTDTAPNLIYEFGNSFERRRYTQSWIANEREIRDSMIGHVLSYPVEMRRREQIEFDLEHINGTPPRTNSTIVGDIFHNAIILSNAYDSIDYDPQPFLESGVNFTTYHKIPTIGLLGQGIKNLDLKKPEYMVQAKRFFILNKLVFELARRIHQNIIGNEQDPHGIEIEDYKISPRALSIAARSIEFMVKHTGLLDIIAELPEIDQSYYDKA